MKKSTDRAAGKKSTDRAAGKKSTDRAAGKKSTDRGRAFTLLEVLAAVAILGIWFTVLANVAIQGLRSEGQNERRIRASLLADRVLTDIELGIDAGELPGENVDVQEQDEFTIRVEQLPLTGFEFAELDEDLMALLEGDLAALAADLYTLQIRITWIEGASEQSIHRTTYVWDSGPLMELLQQSTPIAPPAEEDDEYEEGDFDDDDEPDEADER